MKIEFVRSFSLASLFGRAVALPSELANIKEYGSITQEHLDNFTYYAQHASASYCNMEKPPGCNITCREGCPLLEQNEVSIASTFNGILSGIAGFVAVDDVRNEVVLAVRGTANIRNFVTDVQFLMADCDVVKGAAVHAGFLNAWNEVSATVLSGVESALASHNGYRLVIVGHSLGAGVATIAAAYLRRDGYAGTDLYTYGSPRVGNAVFADYVTAQKGSEYRITHYTDMTSLVPPLILGYRHTSMEYWLSTGPETRLDYPVKDIFVCKGSANLSCSGSIMPALSFVPHRYILADMYACGGLKALT